MPSRQRGVGLIEVLISVLVMSIGLLGIAALQATALRSSQSSLERSQATVHSYAILETMRANLDAARAGVYRSGNLELSKSDLVAWITALKTDLGESAYGTINCVAWGDSTTRDCTITVVWNDSRGAGGEENQTMVTVARL
ncbi:type IV pilus modification protein PilV [Lysobacter sp.]|uniref:type IV pilus modification protein PilV n=1 Tax=Lysobacter sp. TaxID=72226 RepID=UPI002D3E996D|nr:type IV pilus modification protein PilV [Lysobacter sp.]HZX78205.1 type IV pilus modification protein PilV [Lysobacter sp.]